MNFAKLMRGTVPPPPLEPPPHNAERVKSPPPTPAAIQPIDTANLVLKEHLASALLDDGGASSPTSQTSPRPSSPPTQRRPSVASNRSPPRTDTSPAKTSLRHRASIQVCSETPPTRRLSRAPSISVPNFDRQQFDKDAELVLLIDQLKGDLKRSQAEVAKLQKKLVDRAKGLDVRQSLSRLGGAHAPTGNLDSAAPPARYLEEKCRHLEAENARLRQAPVRQQGDADKRRILELESALNECKRTERRALHLVVTAVGKDRLAALLRNPKLADLSLEERVGAAMKSTNAPAPPSRSTTKHQAAKAKPKPLVSPEDDALDARSQQLDVLWKEHCGELYGGEGRRTFDRVLRQ
ncbi:Aste57867_17054 [Aphanomyces stellatus]|uniref:Aste57867_17054 protein n=1 Tax=Aphanomyces stellatus TaxID=120398 RepID=A0A485L6W3_9STRA|nr:hypothetical protein As57867_016996 [Aphanomyces stellatus]VFT93815.1 Aste57867_17054 [Aphanomyces stellatus]